MISTQPTLTTLTPLAAGEQTWDLIVVGAGLAGALAAHGAARNGLEVLLVEAARYPRVKVCGGCLSARALAALDNEGLLRCVEASGAQPFESLHLRAPGTSAIVSMPRGAVIDRSRFDRALVSAAIEFGAHFIDGARAALAGISSELRHVRISMATSPAPGAAASASTLELQARFVIWAGGLASIAPRDLAAPEHRGSSAVTAAQQRIKRPRTTKGSRIGAGTILQNASKDFAAGSVHMICGRAGYVGVARGAGDRLNVAAAFNPAALAEHRSPGAVAAQIFGENNMEPPRGIDNVPWRATPPMMRSLPRAAAPRLLVIGDAAGYAEPFTGEGMARAIESGSAAAHCAANTLAMMSAGFGAQTLFQIEDAWNARHRAEQHQYVCRSTAWLLKHPRLASLAIGAAARCPALLAPLIRSVQSPAQVHMTPQPAHWAPLR